MRRNLEITRERILLVAQRLFAELSFYRTTMKDIADAAKVSRRTLYTYFNSKEEIYNRIIDQKIALIEQKINEAQAIALPADKRMKLYIKERFKLIGELMCSSEYIKQTYLYNYFKIEMLRKNIDAKELELLTEILADGAQSGLFAVENPRRFAGYLQPVFKSLEFGFIRRYELQPPAQVINEYIHILFYGIIKKQS